MQCFAFTCHLVVHTHLINSAFSNYYYKPFMDVVSGGAVAEWVREFWTGKSTLKN